MILEAFAKYLQAADNNIPATDILARWLWERLSLPSESVVDQVLRLEISVSLNTRSKGGRSSPAVQMKPTYLFTGNSVTGLSLLKSLYEYCLSYEQQRWARWLHSVKASDFKYCK